MSRLFDTIKLGQQQLNNRIFMAPMTRGRASPDGVPTELMAKYYAQRAEAGLIITEAVAVSKDGLGWWRAPGIFTAEQQRAWKTVGQAINAEQGHAFMQLWHMGACVHPDFLGGKDALSASDCTLSGEVHTPSGEKKQLRQARAMQLDEIQQTQQDFVVAAKAAIDAGFSGVEVHAANGFLLDQFLRDGSNQRSDLYGGSINKRCRLVLELIDAVADAIGEERVGIRLSPSNAMWGIADSQPLELFSYLVEQLNSRKLAYLHVLEPKPEFGHVIKTVATLAPTLRKLYRGTFILNGGFDQERAEQALNNNEADAIAFGVPFIANPDLVYRYKNKLSLNEVRADYFYTSDSSLGAEGYSDYPLAKQQQVQQNTSEQPA
ncbi:alkene reductase [Agaribacterium haliotis]|uniref:alkene reductase n=1 Tax=Agaribacterium haliotis TaxID=2013869 RepID=UPI000BB57DD4|nr:alkene reductase [Agaribacterium haliotis]